MYLIYSLHCAANYIVEIILVNMEHVEELRLLM